MFLKLCTLSSSVDSLLERRLIKFLTIFRSSQRRFTHATVLGLPGKEVQKSRQRLTDEAETDPEDAIADDLAIFALHLLERESDLD